MKESGKKKEKSSFVKQLPIFICFLLIGAVCGLLIGKVLGGMIKEKKELSDILLSAAVLFMGMYLGIFLQTTIHEAGHLIFGLLSGYRYSSFRIGSLMWVKNEGKIRLKRMSIAGTGGQCLMEPPVMVEGKVPYVLYNLGGSIFNAVSAVFFLVLYFFFCQIPYLATICLMFAIIGFADALINGVPMRLGSVNNDGDNALSLGKDREALRSFWVQMQANARSAQGMRMKDMPQEWFTMPSEEGLKNSMTATMGVFVCGRLMDEMRFAEADALMKQLLEADTAIVDLHRNMMLCDRIYCNLVLSGSKETVDELLTKELKSFMKAMKKFPSVLRTEYVYALLHEKDAEKAKKLLADFAKAAKKHPYDSDIESERELLEYAKNYAQNKDSD